MIRSVYKLQLLLVVIFSIFFTLFPFVLLHNSRDGMQNKWMLSLFPVLGIFLFYASFRKAPRVILDENFITIRKLGSTKTLDWSDVQEVFLSKKEYYMGQSMEATVIIFNNGDKLILWDHMYSNGAEMRNFINSKAGPKEMDPPPTITEKSIYSVNRRIYAGNAFTSLNTLLITGMAIYFFFVIKGSPNNGSRIFIPVGLIALFYFLLGTQMNYFLIDDGYVIIKNHYFPWQSIKFSLNDIESVDIETPYRRSTGLRILFKNFKSKIYGAGTLRDHNWKDLLNDLKLIGIPARDDRH